MTSTEWDSAFEAGAAVCGAQHPDKKLAVTCALRPGPNADREIADDNALNGLRLEPVHVHKGMDRDGVTHRWEDGPDGPPPSTEGGE